METLLRDKTASAGDAPTQTEHEQKATASGAFAVNDVEQKVRPAERTESDYLRMAAERRERRGEPVTALLFRNEAYRLEKISLDR